MSRHISITRFLSAVLLLDIALIALVSFSATGVGTLLSHHLPGTFGPGMGAAMTGNHLLGALIVYLDALLFLAAGFGVLLGASRRSLMIGADGIARLLGGTAGLSREDIAATSFAVAEEQKSEIHVLHTGRNLVWIGAVLLLLAFPAICFTWARADSAGAPLLRDAGGTVANTALTVEDVAIFAADQLGDAVLLDIPRVYDWHATSLTPGSAHVWLRPFVLLYHILAKLIVLAVLFAAWRSGHLRAYLLGMAGLDSVSTASLRDAPVAAPAAANDHLPAPEPPGEESLPSQPQPQQTVWEHPHEQAAPAPEGPILEVPVYVAPEPAPQQPEPVPAPEPTQLDEPLTLEASMLEVPADAAPEPAPPQPESTPAPEQAQLEEPLSLEASILEVPANTEPESRPPVAPELALSDAPLTLHEFKMSPAEQAVVEAGALAQDGDNIHRFPYKNTALHLDSEIDA